MKPTTVKTNYTNDDLWCIYSKEKIHIGEKYFTIYEVYRGEQIEKNYKIEYLEMLNEE